MLEETIESVICQSYTNWECIIVDDHSSDGSYELALELSNSNNKIKAYKREGTTSGAPRCRNEGMMKSKGDYIIFLDSDDILAPFCLEQRAKYISKYPFSSFIIFPILVFNKKLDDLNMLHNIKTEENDLDRFIKKDIVWLIMGPIWKRDFLLKIKGFDENLPSQQDYDIHVRALLESPLYVYVKTTPDTYYRQITTEHPGRRSSSPTHLLAREAMLEKLIKLTISKNKMTGKRNFFFAQHLMHLALMWIWQKKTYSGNTFILSLRIWKIGRNEKLFGQKIFFTGCIYLALKNMLFLKQLRSIYNFLIHLCEQQLVEKYLYKRSSTVMTVKYIEGKTQEYIYS